MVYKKQATILAILTGFLALVYAAALIFNPDRTNVRASAYRWLEPRWAAQADSIEIRTAAIFTLSRENGYWRLETGGLEYPVKQTRVEDLLGVLSTQGSYPPRGGAASHERLGLTEGTASRIIIRGGAGLPLLDLLIGKRDASGRDVYLRKNNQDEVRSGEDRFDAFLSGGPQAWYDLRLLPGPLSLDAVQRVTVIAPPAEAESAAPPPLVISRRETGWIVEGLAPETQDSSRIEPYIRSILDAEGDAFISAVSAQDPVFTQGRITLESEDGSIRRISLGPELREADRVSRSAVVSGSPYVYALTEWMVNRLFKDAAYFTLNEGSAD